MTHARVERYLHELAFAAEETAADLRLLPTLVRVLLRAPGTLLELAAVPQAGPPRDCGACPGCGDVPQRGARRSLR